MQFLTVLPSSFVMSHIHIGPEIKKKTEEEDVECEEDLILACQPETPVKALDFEISENQTGMLPTRFF